MLDCSQLILDKKNIIIEKWLAAVRADSKIESTKNLPRSAIENHLGEVLSALSTVLSQYQKNEVEAIVQASLEHGKVRAGQGYDATEIAREYRILRQVIFDTLEIELLRGSAAEAILVVRLIDLVIDEAIGRCFQTYTKERLHELEQLQNQLILNNQELTRLIRDNQDNLSHLAHELKNPLTSIIGYADLFLRQQRSKTELRDTSGNLEHVERVLRSGRQLLRLINDALEISRYEAGKMKLQPEPTNVRELIHNVIEMLEPVAQSKDLQIVVNCQFAPDEVVTDSLRLQQIVTNLVSNAIRYTESGTIKLTCQVLDGEHKWSIAVSDTGIGITRENLAHIFEPYFRVVTDSNSYLAESTGLGLAIASRLTKLLQGEIQVVSHPGKGSTFTVILPLRVRE